MIPGPVDSGVTLSTRSVLSDAELSIEAGGVTLTRAWSKRTKPLGADSSTSGIPSLSSSISISSITPSSSVSSFTLMTDVATLLLSSPSLTTTSNTRLIVPGVCAPLLN